MTATKHMLAVAQRSEREFIAHEQSKLDLRLRFQLRAVKRHSMVSRKVIEALQVNGLTEFGGPSDSCRYNHDRLTTAGIAKLAELDAI